MKRFAPASNATQAGVIPQQGDSSRAAPNSTAPMEPVATPTRRTGAPRASLLTSRRPFMRISPLLKTATVVVASSLPLAALMGCSSSKSNGSPPDASTEAATSTLYARLGGHAGIRKAVDAIVGAELMDTRIASFFFNQVASPVPAGHPTVDQLSECFTDLLGSA